MMVEFESNFSFANFFLAIVHPFCSSNTSTLQPEFGRIYRASFFHEGASSNDMNNMNNMNNI